MSTIAKLVRDATVRLAAVGVPSPQVDSEILMAVVLGVSRGEMIAQQVAGATVSSSQEEQFEAFLTRRETREPLQHMVGLAPFMDFEVAVGPGVFVPRPETEALCVQAIIYAQNLGVPDGHVRIVDLCSGSGVLAIALARALVYAKVQAVEISPEASAYLTANVARLAPSVAVLEASVQEFMEGVQPGSIDMVVSNPPYVPDSEIPNDPEVARWDPALALFGGRDGLDIVRDIVNGSREALRPGGLLMVEHSNLHGEPVRELLLSAGYRMVQTEQDLTGRDRFSVGVRP
jgi:release factor glutamine methyltransferase